MTDVMAVQAEAIRVHIESSDVSLAPAKDYRERVAAPSSFAFAAGDPPAMIAGHSPNRCRLTVACSGGAALLCQSRADAQSLKGAKITDTMVLFLTATSELWAVPFDGAATPTLGVVPEYEH